MTEQQETPKENAYEYVADLSNLPQPELTGHQWRQQGNSLICMSCPFRHATGVPFGKQLYGLDDQGNPMFRDMEY